MQGKAQGILRPAIRNTQRDRAEQERTQEQSLHERDIAEYKMKLHTVEGEVEKLQVRLERSLAEKDKLPFSLSLSVSNKIHRVTNHKVITIHQNIQ